MSEKRNEIFVSTLKGLIGAIPTIGTALNEAIFEHRARVKQNRVNKFVEDLAAYMKGRSIEDHSFEQISSDQFGDIFEAIIKEVAETSSDEKKKRFKLILANQLLNPIKTDFVEVYIDVIAKLNDMQIKILAAHYSNKTDYETLRKKRMKLLLNVEQLNTKLKDEMVLGAQGLESATRMMINKELAEAEHELKKFDEAIEVTEGYRDHSYYGISEGEFYYYKQDLVTKGIMQELISVPTAGKYSFLEVTDFAIGLLEFINEGDAD